MRAVAAAPPPSRWTFFSYLTDASPDIRNAPELEEMKRAVGNKGLVQAVALVDSKKGGKLVHITPGRAKTVQVAPQSKLGRILKSQGAAFNTGDPATLAAALEYVRKVFPSENLALDISGHGSGWYGVAFDTSSPGRAHLSMPELEKALAATKPDVVLLNACSMGSAEVAQAVAASGSRFMVASQSVTAASGQDYAKLLPAIAKSVKASPRSTKAVAEAIAKTQARTDPWDTSVAVTDLAKMPQLSAAIESLAEALLRVPRSQRAEVKAAYRSALRFSDDQVDLGDFAEALRDTGLSSLEPSASALLRTLRSTVKVERDGMRGQSSGLSIYAPASGRAISSGYFLPDALWANSKWLAWLKTL